MPTISLGTTAKRKNSTAIPTMSWTGSGAFKRPTSLFNPTVQLTISDPSGYNVMELMGRYYWITDIRSITGDIWEITGEIDGLATCRDDVLRGNQFVEYAQLNYDPALPDTRLMAINAPRVSASTYTFFAAQSPHYVLTVIGVNGAANSYVLTGAELAQLITSINTYQSQKCPDILASQSITEIIERVGQAIVYIGRQLFSFGDVMQCLISCYWEPWEPIHSDVMLPLYLGDYDTGISASIISDSPRTMTHTIQFDFDSDPDHAFLNYAPYRTYYLYIPVIGVLHLPSDRVIAAGGQITLSMSYASKTGELGICISAGDDRVITESAVIRGEIPIGKVSTDPVAFVTQGIRIGTGDLSALPDLARSLLDSTVESTGSVATMAALGLPWEVRAITIIKDVPGLNELGAEAQGRPVNRALPLNVFLGGYCRCRNPEISSTQPLEVVRGVEMLLERGVYLE